MRDYVLSLGITQIAKMPHSDGAYSAKKENIPFDFAAKAKDFTHFRRFLGTRMLSVTKAAKLYFGQ
jgi:hypothetical protein